MYVPLQVNRSQKCNLLIVQYTYMKSCSRDFYSPESDPPHKIMRYWVYYSIQLVFGFPPDRICQVEMICIGGVPVLKRHFGGAGPQIFYMIHRGGRRDGEHSLSLLLHPLHMEKNNFWREDVWTGYPVHMERIMIERVNGG